MWDIPSLIPVLDAGEPIVLLGGVHAGCYELFGNDRVNAVRDLKGKTVAVSALGNSEHVFVSVMLAYVGIDPRRADGVSTPDTRSTSERREDFRRGRI